MATIPTLTIGVVDQTDFIQNKTFSTRLHTLDVVLLDPVTTPELHDVVSVDDPAWHGRVSTIESNPYRVAGGTDHRWVKITCTNKTVAASASAPFGISDAPNLSTTFPYKKDFTYTQTLADQTDLASAEHRLKATIYESGIVPGMTVPVTNAAEGLSADDFIVTEVTVSWLRDDVPEYLIEASVEGVPPVTLGGLIDSAGCDCAPFDCPATDYTVYSNVDNIGDMACVIAMGENTCHSDNSSPGPMFHLYDGATYKIEYFVYHSGITCRLNAGLTSPTSSAVADESMGSQTDPGTWGPALTYATTNYTNVTGDDDYCTVLNGISGAGCTNVGSEISTKITYVSGPDPRYETLPGCPDPHSGQLVLDGSFTGDGTTTDYTTTYPYGAHTINVFVNGLDWTTDITESDPTTGDYALAYPPPFGATVRPVYRGA